MQAATDASVAVAAAATETALMLLQTHAATLDLLQPWACEGHVHSLWRSKGQSCSPAAVAVAAVPLLVQEEIVLR